MLKRQERAEPKSCWNKAKEDEQVFILLARDLAAPSVIRFWCGERVRLGLNRYDDEQIVNALHAAGAMAMQREGMKAA